MAEPAREKSCGAIVSALFGGDKRILLIRHKNGGHWAFPKGHVEGMETEEETALREILEETGLAVTLDTRFRTSVTYSPKKNVRKDVVYFAAEADLTDAVPQPEEVTELRWAEPEEALRLITFENDRGVLRRYLEFLSR